MFITSNIEQDTHTPSIGLSLKWDRSSLVFKVGYDFRWQHDKEFIPEADAERSGKDDIYIDNMPEQKPFSEQDHGYTFSVLYETDVKMLYALFSEFYQLAAYPIFAI